MYVNKCIKCGREFETKNPKRVICPDCLYPDKSMIVNTTSTSAQTSNIQSNEQVNNYINNEQQPKFYSSYSSGGEDNNQRPYNRPQRSYNQNDKAGYNRDNRQGSYGNNRPNYRSNQGGYNRDNRQGSYNRQGGYGNNRSGGYNNRQNGGFGQRRPQNNRFNNRRPMGHKARAPKQLLVSKEQLEQIELLYKLMLPLPNPDAHEVIGEKIGLEPRKVFFGINLVRQKMMLTKLPYPKRKLAISPDQLNAIKMLYEPLLPLPPIGCHKIIAAQLKMDEWRVHVGIGLVRAQLGMDRWNQDRADLTDEMKQQIKETNAQKEAEKLAKKQAKEAEKNNIEDMNLQDEVNVDNENAEDSVAEVNEAPKKKRGRKPKATEDVAVEE